MYIVFGLIFGSANYGEAQDVAYYDHYTSSFLGIILLNTALFNVGPSLVVYKELGFFRRLMVTPLSINAIIFSTLLKAFLIFLVGILEVILMGGSCSTGCQPRFPVYLLVALAVAAFSLFAFGFMLGSLFKTANAASPVPCSSSANAVSFGERAFPLKCFREPMLMLSQLVPMTHVVELIRLAWDGQDVHPGGNQTNPGLPGRWGDLCVCLESNLRPFRGLT